MDDIIKFSVLTLPSESLKFCPNCSIGLKEDDILLHFKECLLPTWQLKFLSKPKLFRFNDFKICPNCSKVFANDQALDKHRYFCDPSNSLSEFNTNAKPLLDNTQEFKRRRKKGKSQCPVCHKFFNETYLSYHMNVHTGERPFQCDQCSSSFKDPAALKAHTYTHTDYRPYKCDLCEDKAFR